MRTPWIDKFKLGLKEGLKNLYDLYVYIDGRFVKGEDAKVSVYDHAFLYGDGVFEGIRVYDGLIFKLDEHINRLYDSAKAIALDIPLDREEFKKVILETVRINGLRNAHIRPVVSRGFGRPGFDPRRSVRPTVVIMAYPFPPFLGERPLRLITSSIRRNPPQAQDAKIKSLSYLNNILGKLQANAVGVDEAIMLDIHGYIAEACTENIFIVKNDRLSTPPPTSCLCGITRDTIIDIAKELGYEVAEKNLTLQELYVADEVFLTGTGAEMVPVAEIDGRKIGKAKIGPITKKLMDTYTKLVREESPYTTNIYT